MQSGMFNIFESQSHLKYYYSDLDFGNIDGAGFLQRNQIKD